MSESRPLLDNIRRKERRVYERQLLVRETEAEKEGERDNTHTSGTICDSRDYKLP